MSRSVRDGGSVMSAPRRAWTIRARLTVLYGAVFLLTGVILLTVGYLLVRADLQQRIRLHDQLGLSFRPTGPDAATETAIFEHLRTQLIHQTLRHLVLLYALALALMTAVSGFAGWLLAGRALAPLRRIIATAQRVSIENLGERIALEGPADELRELADTFDGMLARLDAAFVAQRRFVANASHELRTPLAIMRTELEVALAEPRASAGDLRHMGEELRETLDRCEGLIGALLTLARAEAASPRAEPVDLEQLAGDVVTDHLAAAATAGVVLDTDRLEPAGLLGDQALLERLVANLVDNGIRHNRAGGRLTVATCTEAGSARLEVVSDGAPISARDAATLTQPFRRLHREAGGFGLGLSIVESICTVHGGRLVVRAREAGGLAVRVDFPAAAGAPGRPAAPVATATAARSPQG